jgi:uncharacterized repeat protein (TIGR02543 family)
MKRSIFMLFAVITIFGGCFSDWAGDGASITIHLGGGGGRATFPPNNDAIKASLSYTVDLQGPSNMTGVPIPADTLKLNLSVTPGSYTITVTAYLGGEVYATGSATVEAQAGKPTPVTIKMSYAGEYEYTVTFVTDSGTEIEPQTVKEGGTATRPTPNPTRDGFGFVGWYTDNETWDFLYNFENTPVTSDITLYAKWSETIHTVTFDSNGGSPVEPKTVGDGGTVQPPTAPTKSGHVFVGWYTDTSFSAEYDFDNTPVTSNITLYAKWSETVTTVTIAAIAGVTPPSTGATPVASITETAQYTGAVTWSPTVTDNAFAANQVYTATITLTLKDGYTLEGVATNFFTVAGAASASNAANSNSVTAVFPKTALTFDSITAFATWLGTATANSAAEAYNVKLNVADLGGSVSTSGSLGAVLLANDTKYVNLDLSGSTTIPAIPDNAFSNQPATGGYQGCTTLVGITMPNSVTSIGTYAFFGCTNLASITMQDGVQSIGDSAFQSCTSLTSVTIPDSVMSIGNAAFYGCNKLISITIPSSVTSIVNTFNGCTSLASITIPDSVTTIGDSAFNGCTSLASITIPDSVTTIGDYAFMNCTSLTSVTFEGTSKVTTIGDYAFSYCTSLASITIPNSVTTIGDYAFMNCTSLTSVTFEGIIASGNFNTTTPFPGNLRTAFYATDNANGTPGSYVRESNGTAWALGQIFNSISDFTQWLNASTNNDTYAVKVNVADLNGRASDSGSLGYALRNNPNKYINLDLSDSTITSIGEQAFMECTSLVSITIPDSVTAIGDTAFHHCESLISITIPDSVTSIGGQAFSYSTTLASVTFEGTSKVATIGDYAFEHCTSLASVIIPDSVTSISWSAFSYCDDLTEATIGSGVTSIGLNAFSYCGKLDRVTFKSADTVIADANAFHNGTTLLAAYSAGGAGTYIWQATNVAWSKQQ